MQFVKDYIISLSVVLSTILLTILPIFGVVRTEDEESSVYSLIIILVNGLSLMLIVTHEMTNYKKARGCIWPYLIPLLVAFCYLFDMIVHLTLSKVAQKMFVFFLANSMVGIYAANYLFRYRKIDVFFKNIESVFILGAVGLIISLPSMYATDYNASLSGGGGHLVISYSAAFYFSYFYIHLFSKNYKFQYQIFSSRYVKYFEYFLLISNIVVCFTGGGRGGASLLVVNFIVCSLLIFRKNIPVYIIRAAMLLFCFAIIFPFLSSSSPIVRSLEKGHERAFSFIDASGEIDMEETSGRDRIYRTTLKLIEEEPVAGYGVFHQIDVCNNTFHFPYCHNIELEVLLQGGVLLFIPFLILMTKVLSSGYKYIKYESLYFLPFITLPVFELQFSGTYIKTCLFWFLIVYLLNYRKI